MSTNFYVLGMSHTFSPDFHVGKRVSIGDGKTAFNWAMTPQRFADLKNTPINHCETCTCMSTRFEDEYGEVYSWDEMSLIIYKQCSSVYFDSIGQQFC